MKPLGLVLLTAAAGLWLASAALADTVYLHDGRKIQGKVTSADGAATVTVDTPCGAMELRATEVERIVKGDVKPPPPASGPDASYSTPDQTPAPTPALPTGVDPAVRERFAEAKKNADKAGSGADGLAIWEQFLKDCPAGPLAEVAKRELGVWKGRADKNLVRFGPMWLPKEKVEGRLAKAEELFTQADSAGTPEEAAKLLTQAAGEHPYRADIPFKKAMIFYRAKRLREFGTALGEVVKVDPNHVAARNNLGVLSAQQEQWGLALANVARAAAYADIDVVLDNLDQVMATAEAAGASASTLGSGTQQIQQVVARLHKAGKHAGEQRWGNTWVSQAQYDRYLKENADIDRTTAASKKKFLEMQQRFLRLQKPIDDYNNYVKAFQGATGTTGVVGTTGAYYDPVVAAQLKTAYDQATQECKTLEAEGKKLQTDIQAAEAKKNVPPHAGKLVLLQADGSLLEAVDVKKVDAPRAGGGPAAGGARLLN